MHTYLFRRGLSGTRNIDIESAVTAVVIEGALFFALALAGVRYAIIKLIPEPVRITTPAASGFCLQHLGLLTADGIGIVESNTSTAVTLGACPIGKQIDVVALTDSCMKD
jgi:xanthine/uracil/vitamin C permease (AzgA family)